MHDVDLRLPIKHFLAIKLDAKKMSTEDTLTNAGKAIQELKIQFFRFAAAPNDPQEERVRKIIGLAIVSSCRSAAAGWPAPYELWRRHHEG